MHMCPVSELMRCYQLLNIFTYLGVADGKACTGPYSLHPWLQLMRFSSFHMFPARQCWWADVDGVFKICVRIQS